MKRLLRILLPTALAVVGLAAIALPASATTASLNTGGCTGTGYTQQYGWFAATSSSCNWRYVDCWWQKLNGSYEHNGPGWVQYSPSCNPGPGEALNPTVHGHAYHSLCAAGGPCGPSSYYYTYEPS